MLIKGLYEVTQSERNDDQVIAEVRLNAGHDVFKGHFPGRPVLPGVCQLQMVQELLAEQLQKDLRLKRSNTIKFMAIIDPSADPDLLFDIKTSEIDGGIKANAKLSFGETVAAKMVAEFQFA